MLSTNPASTPPSKRRQRTESQDSSQQSESPSKRTKTHASTMASTIARGKKPQVVDLTLSPANDRKITPASGARKLVIKNLRLAEPERENQVKKYYATAQRDLEGALDAVFVCKTPEVPFERLYRETEDLCRKGYAADIHKALKEKTETHLNRVVLSRITREGGGSDANTLKAVLAEWKVWNKQTVTIRSTFSYFNQTYLLQEALPTINEMAITQFRKTLFSSGAAYESCPGKMVIGGICDLIDLHRKTGSTDTNLLKEGIMMLYVLGVYVKRLDPELSRQSTLFFEQFAEAGSASTLKDYIFTVEKLLQKEHLRTIEFNLDSATEKRLMDSAHSILIEKYSDKLLDGGNLSKLLASNEVASMKGLYELLRLSKIEQNLKQPWGAYVQDTGAGIISDKERGDEMVVRLLLLRRSLDVMVRDAFAKDDTFVYEMRNAFAKFINDTKIAKCWSTGTSKVGEMNAKHIDQLLRGGLKALPAELMSDNKDKAHAEKEGQASTGDEDAELDRQLDAALELFRFIEGKDTFEAFYKRDLARRLLMGRSASADAERSMLTKLRSECGTSFTHNLEQMFKDQELAKDEMLAYQQSGDNADRKAPLDLSVMVLSAAAWPTYPDVQLSLPDQVACELERWEKYYISKHTGRTVKWKHSLAHCSLKAKFPKGAKELLVSAFQGVVLSLFNDVPTDEALAYEQISTATGLVGDDLQRTLQSLACGKTRLITKHPKGKDVNKTDTFTFNKAFTDPRYRVKVNQIQHKETKAENKATQERIAQDRKFETQAAIVRIMKSRKTMGHSELVAEVITMTKKRGSVEPAAIKKEIETLIEKDYLERDGNSYTYQA